MFNVFTISLGFFLASAAAAQELPPKIAAVQQYLLEEEYPEVFGKQNYRVKLEDAVVADVDDDGNEEVILLVKPHYRQSPPIVLFKVSKKMKVKRVVEGLAPGPLVQVSGDYLDSHTLGMAVDFTMVSADKDLKKRKEMVRITMKNFRGVVEYRNFVHADGREGKAPVYIDMTHIEPPPEANCEAFEFSTVDAVKVMSKDDGSGNYLLALVGEKIYAYKINGISSDGLLDKTLTVMSAKP